MNMWVPRVIRAASFGVVAAGLFACQRPPFETPAVGLDAGLPAEVEASQPDPDPAAAGGAGGGPAAGGLGGSAGAAPVGIDAAAGAGEPMPRLYRGPDGATISAAAEDLQIQSDCSGMVSDLFSARFGCMHLAAKRLVGMARICYPNAQWSTSAHVLHCSAPVMGAACASQAYLIGDRCCSALPGGVLGNDPICGDVGELGDFAGGLLADSDGDFAPDLSDNCVDVSNLDQRDSVGDGIGDACRADAGAKD
jgi:hypothetical protein